MNRKKEGIGLAVVSLIIIGLLVGDYIVSGSFIIFRGGLISSVLIILGILSLVWGWVSFFLQNRK